MSQKFAEQNRAEYGENYNRIKFCTEEQARDFNQQRNFLIEQLSKYVQWGFNGTKADCTKLSNGCVKCGEGLWSCLFINGLCNARCFYCPAPQDDKFLPTTNSVSFNSPDEYVAYLKEFGFKGVSISGGEPLLTFDLTLSYISAVRNAFGNDMYIWLYTNGILINENLMRRLSEAGLNEIRFDIGAADYKLDRIKKAVKLIPVVTVEIPAVPEDFEIMKETVKEMADIGVGFLNLHQLRLTPHNFEKLMSRNYTYIHNESVTVIESELTALKLIEYVYSKGIGLNVNYCSFPYKNRYQGLAARKRSCGRMVKGFEEITENGYIRLLTLKGNTEKIQSLISGLKPGRYELNKDKTAVSLPLTDISSAEISGLDKSVSYFSARQLPSVSYRNPFKIIKLTDSMNMVIERFRVSHEIQLESLQEKAFPAEALKFEKIDSGLLDYI